MLLRHSWFVNTHAEPHENYEPHENMGACNGDRHMCEQACPHDHLTGVGHGTREYVCPYCHGIAMGYGMYLNRHVPLHEITGTWHIYEAQQIRCDCLKTLCKIHGLVLLIN